MLRRYAHHEREEDLLARRKQHLDTLIDKERGRDELKRFLKDYRKRSKEAYPDRPPLLEYNLEVLNISDVKADWDWEHLEHGDLLSFE